MGPPVGAELSRAIWADAQTQLPPLQVVEELSSK
jgi:hypothetical protein